MKPYIAQIRSNLRLMARDRSVLFFSAVFPLTFFFLFAQVFEAGKSPGAMAQVLASVVIIGVLGNGFFGAGMRTVQDRETNVLRRFKVAPINAAPVIVASMVSGLANFLPNLFLFLIFARVVYHSPFPSNTLSLVAFVSIGLLSFRAIGMIVASVVNSAQEGNLVIQLLYLPMLFLSGATFPVSVMPVWVQTIAQFLPATYLYQGVQSLIIGGESLAANWFAVVALLVAMAVALFVGVKLFRWEKEEKIANPAKLWILAVLAPFFLLGIYQAKTKENIGKTKILARQVNRSRSWLYQNARIVIGDGRVIENGSLLVRAGKLERIFDKPPANPNSFNANIANATGKTIVPGLIDMHVHVGAPGGYYSDPKKYADTHAQRRRLAAYLYSGIVAVRSTGDFLDATLKLRSEIHSGEYLGAEVFTCGPLFTAPGGHPTELLEGLPRSLRQGMLAQFVRLPASTDEARRMVDDLHAAHVDCIKGVLEAGSAHWGNFPHLDAAIYRAVVDQARHDSLPVATHTGNAADVQEAIAAGTQTIEHGSMSDLIPPAAFAAMKAKGISYDPTLSVVEGIVDVRAGNTKLLDRALLRQVGPADLLSATHDRISKDGKPSLASELQPLLTTATQNLLNAYLAGVTLIAGSDAGNVPVVHGPTIQHELALWVQAGIPASVALQAATGNAARALRADNRLGLIAPGRDASFLVVDGDPLTDIGSLEHISSILLQGERISRSDLFDQEKP